RCAAVPLRACSLFSFWSRRSRRSTLFPYTTLFRSEDARLRAEGCGRTEGCGADRHERTQAECDLSEQRATNGGQHAREGTDASHDAGQEHETASKAADSSEDRAEIGRAHV